MFYIRPTHLLGNGGRRPRHVRGEILLFLIYTSNVKTAWFLMTDKTSNVRKTGY